MTFPARGSAHEYQLIYITTCVCNFTILNQMNSFQKSPTHPQCAISAMLAHAKLKAYNSIRFSQETVKDIILLTLRQIPILLIYFFTVLVYVFYDVSGLFIVSKVSLVITFM